jgi:hypothetical protein
MRTGARSTVETTPRDIIEFERRYQTSYRREAFANPNRAVKSTGTGWRGPRCTVPVRTPATSSRSSTQSSPCSSCRMRCRPGPFPAGTHGRLVATLAAAGVTPPLVGRSLMSPKRCWRTIFEEVQAWRVTQLSASASSGMPLS